METEPEKQGFLESIYEMLVLIKICLTSIWFWLPPLMGVFVVFELYLLCVNPLLLMIAPGIMIAYALIWEEKRTKAQYGLKQFRVINSSDPMFSTPREVAQDLNVEQAVKEYTDMLKQKPRKNMDKAKEQ